MLRHEPKVTQLENIEDYWIWDSNPGQSGSRAQALNNNHINTHFTATSKAEFYSE